MAKRKKSSPEPTRPTPTELKLKYGARVQRDVLIAQCFQTLARCSTLCIGVYCVYLSVKVMSGKSTDFRAVIDWAVSADISKWAGYAIAAVLGGGWRLERRRNRKVIEQYGPRLTELEAAHDPGRSSSGLTRDGSTPVEDEA